MEEQKDRHLKAPGEANRDKHINFAAQENGDDDPAKDDFSTDNDFDNDDDLEEQENNINEDESAVINDPYGKTNAGKTSDDDVSATVKQENK